MVKYVPTKTMEDDMKRKRKGGYVYGVTNECFRQDYKRQIPSRSILGYDVLCASMSDEDLFICDCQVNGKVFCAGATA